MSRQASGLKAWIVQRVSALYLALFLSYLLLHFTLSPPRDHGALSAWVSSPPVTIALLLFIPVLLAHAWVGIRDVLLDYVHPLGARLALLSLCALLLLASGLWALTAIIAAARP
jgi:succinate dehydrogenase membrane anchor subunit